MVPARNAGGYLDPCLEGLVLAGFLPEQITVVDDASTDDTAARARAHGVRFLRLKRRLGASGARNAGASAADAEIILFVDADVVVYPDVRRRIWAALQDPETAAVFGSYDLHPTGAGVVSRYRNLLHHYIHQHGQTEAQTFWTGCGATRRSAFVSIGGFDTALKAMEDIDLGMRLRSDGWSIHLDRDMLCTHLKRWTLLGVIRTDLIHRAIPWTRLMLERDFATDLNVSPRQRAAVALTGISLAALLLSPIWPVATVIACVAAAGALAANASFFGLLFRTHGIAFTLAALPLQLIHHTCAGLGFGYAWVEHGVRLLSGRRAQTRSASAAT